MDTLPRTPREQGLALLDVLVGLCIFALIAIIAVLGLHQYRERAHETAAISDAKAVGDALAVQATARSHGTSLGPIRLLGLARVNYDALEDPLVTSGQRLTEGNHLVDWTAQGTHFGFCIVHRTDGTVDAFAAYRSDRGGVYAHGRSDGCPDVAWETGDPAPTEDPTASPSPTETTTDPTAQPALWQSPQDEAEIEALCTTDWGETAIRAEGDTIYGTDGPDIIYADNGGQTVYGLGGDDLLCGGNGKDVLHGGAGNDVLFGGNGKDTLYGNGGDDYLHGNNGKDTLDAGDGEADSSHGGHGQDTYIDPTTDDPEDTFESATGSSG